MPQPIDMQTEMARATMADRVQQAVDRAAMAAAMRARVEGDGEQVLAETHVGQAPESQSQHIDPELKRRNPYVRRRTRKAAANQDDPAGASSTARAGVPADHHFDVSV